MIVGYLSAAAADEDPNILLGALAHVAKARGMASVAEAAGSAAKAFTKRWRRDRTRGSRPFRPSFEP